MRIQAVIPISILLLLSSCTQVDQSAAANKAIGERFINEVWNAGNLGALDAIISEDFVHHNPPSVVPSEIKGLDAIKEYISGVRGAYPDFHVEIRSSLAEGALSAARWTVTGTNAENGTTIEFPGISISRYLDGKVVEEWMIWDTESLTDQQEAGSETDGADED